MVNTALSCVISFALGAAYSVFISKQINGKRKRKGFPRPAFEQQPHPCWAPKQPQPCPYPAADEMVAVDPSSYDKASMYTLLISFATPRPIALVSSLSPEGVRNLAPYSFFNVFGYAPPYVVIGCCRGAARGGASKDTYNNIAASGEFVVNFISDWFVEAANHTCGDYDAHVDEFEVSGLTPIPSVRVAPPRVKESAVHLECKLRHTIPTTSSDGRTTMELVVAEVVLVHVSKAVTAASPTGKLVVDPIKYAPVARLGGVSYGVCTSLFDIPRPDKEGRYPARTT